MKKKGREEKQGKRRRKKGGRRKKKRKEGEKETGEKETGEKEGRKKVPETWFGSVILAAIMSKREVLPEPELPKMADVWPGRKTPLRFFRISFFSFWPRKFLASTVKLMFLKERGSP